MSQPSQTRSSNLEVRSRALNEHGRYVALMDLSNFLNNIDEFLPNTEIRNRPTTRSSNPSIIDLTTSVNIDGDGPPAPPLPRMIKNLLKDRRRFQRDTPTTAIVPQAVPLSDFNIMSATHKKIENFCLKNLLEQEMKNLSRPEINEFTTELLFATMCDERDESKDLLKPEMDFRLKKKPIV